MKAVQDNAYIISGLIHYGAGIDSGTLWWIEKKKDFMKYRGMTADEVEQEEEEEEEEEAEQGWHVKTSAMPPFSEATPIYLRLFIETTPT